MLYKMLPILLRLVGLAFATGPKNSLKKQYCGTVVVVVEVPVADVAVAEVVVVDDRVVVVDDSVVVVLEAVAVVLVTDVVVVDCVVVVTHQNV